MYRLACIALPSVTAITSTPNGSSTSVAATVKKVSLKDVPSDLICLILLESSSLKRMSTTKPSLLDVFEELLSVCHCRGCLVELFCKVIEDTSSVDDNTGSLKVNERSPSFKSKLNAFILGADESGMKTET